MIRLKLIFVFILQLTAASAWAEVLPYSTELKQQLADALKSQAADYRPRTQHICKKNLPCYTNRLILENSPYLLQHAHNPVDWYSWNKEALQKAKQENKPIFLSIGYAACHWCHVMEKESFDDLGIAKILNENFIAIKVDRERRPDIDEFYGNAVMYFQGQQGWPMSVFLTPDGKPFNGGGYYTRKEFESLLLKMSDYWNNQQQDVIQKAENVINALHVTSQTRNQALKIDASVRKKALKSLFSIVDNYNGGFGEGSKFPREPWLFLLLDDSYGKPINDDSPATLHMALTHMARGGIYDQLAGGFHRYTTDPYWKIPHFEKMLYNQALLIRIYLRANVIQPDSLYTRVAQQSVDFLLTEMRDPQDAFYSALDADTDGQEGRFYLWQLDEWQKILTKEDSEFTAEIFDVDEYGETEDESNILYISTSLEDYAKEHKTTTDKLQKKLNKIRKTLLKIRHQRTRPAIDKKVIMGWNGLTITALAESAYYLDNPKYLIAAIEAANFIWDKMRTDKYFYRTHYLGKNSQPAQLDDYAFYLQALITLYDIDRNKKWLKHAILLTDIMINLFWDKQNGGFFNTPVDERAPLPVRPKSAFDKTLPSGNAVAAHMLIRLFRRTGDDRYLKRANAVFSAFTSETVETPSAFSTLLIASNELQQGEKDLPVYTARGHIRIDAFITPINDNYYDLTIDMQFDEKWHINSHRPLDKQLIPTVTALAKQTQWQLMDIQYPQPEIVKLGFSSQPLSLYQGQGKITSRLKKNSTKLNPVVNLQLQACNDRVCLPPENLLLYPRLLIKNQ